MNEEQIQKLNSYHESAKREYRNSSYTGDEVGSRIADAKAELIESIADIFGVDL